MKREDLLRHLRSHGFQLLREGGRHSWWVNQSVPRHREISDILANKICKDLGIDPAK